MRYILCLLILGLFSAPAYAGDLESSTTGTVIPAKNMTQGSMFSKAKILPETEGDFSAIKDDEVFSVPVFKVNFRKKHSSGAQEKSGNWRSSSTASLHAFVETTGFREEVLQEITDKAHQDFLDRLKAKGLKVLSSEEMLKKSEFLQNYPKKKEYPEIDEDLSTYLATNTMYPSGFTVVSNGRLVSPPSDVFGELATGVFAVTYYVEFVAAGISKQSGMDSAEVSIELGHVANVAGLVQAFGFKKGGCSSFGGCYGPQSSVNLTQVAYSEIPFGKLENTTSSGESAAQVGLAVFGALMGSGSSTSWDSYTLTVDEKKFVEATLDALKKANEKAVSVL